MTSMSAAMQSEKTLPDFCMVCIPVAGNPVVGWALRGQAGIRLSVDSFARAREAHAFVDFLDHAMGVAETQEVSMLAGSMLGWKGETRAESTMFSGQGSTSSARRATRTKGCPIRR
jgi:hypothetical protein